MWSFGARDHSPTPLLRGVHLVASTHTSHDAVCFDDYRSPPNAGPGIPPLRCLHGPDRSGNAPWGMTTNAGLSAGIGPTTRECSEPAAWYSVRRCPCP